MKVAPAASTYLRRYGILPNLVTATGPMGHLQKGDVIAYAKKLSLPLLNLNKPTSSLLKKEELKQETKVEPIKQPKQAPAKKKEVKSASPVFNANNPFQQTWNDTDASESLKQAASSLEFAKNMLAHAYISIPCEVSTICNDFKDIPLE